MTGLRRAEFATATKVSERQIDYWTRAGHIKVDNDRPGHGNPRNYPDTEIDVVRIVGALSAAGMTNIAIAFGLARRLADGQPVPIANGLWLIHEPQNGET